MWLSKGEQTVILCQLNRLTTLLEVAPRHHELCAACVESPLDYVWNIGFVVLSLYSIPKGGG